MKAINKIILFVCITLLCVSCKKEIKVDRSITLPFFNSPIFTPEWIAESSREYKSIHKIADFSLINQEGKTITNENYKGKIYVADFFFVSCPGICPILEKNMSILQDEYKEDDEIQLLSHTVMPVKDSVPVLKQYALENGINSKKWNLVTGDKDLIYDLARTSYFADEDFVKTQDKDAFIHTENFVLVDKKGRIRGVYNGTIELEIQRLIRHINLLKKEK